MGRPVSAPLVRGLRGVGGVATSPPHDALVDNLITEEGDNLISEEGDLLISE